MSHTSTCESKASSHGRFRTRTQENSNSAHANRLGYRRVFHELTQNGDRALLPTKADDLELGPSNVLDHTWSASKSVIDKSNVHVSARMDDRKCACRHHREPRFK